MEIPCLVAEDVGSYSKAIAIFFSQETLMSERIRATGGTGHIGADRALSLQQRKAETPEFQEKLQAHPASVVARPRLFTNVAIPELCAA